MRLNYTADAKKSDDSFRAGQGIIVNKMYKWCAFSTVEVTEWHPSAREQLTGRHLKLTVFLLLLETKKRLDISFGSPTGRPMTWPVSPNFHPKWSKIFRTEHIYLAHQRLCLLLCTVMSSVNKFSYLILYFLDLSCHTIWYMRWLEISCSLLLLWLVVQRVFAFHTWSFFNPRLTCPSRTLFKAKCSSKTKCIWKFDQIGWKNQKIIDKVYKSL